MMMAFENLNLSRQLLNALEDLGFNTPTPIQQEAFPVILSGKDVVGISQTGTGKTNAYLLPILQQLRFSKHIQPRILILVPTRELVIQVVENLNVLTKYMTVRILGIYGESNITIQKQSLAQGVDVLVATPGRLYDLALCRAVALKEISKLVIDEVDVMLDLGFRPQLINIFDLMPSKRQNIMFSATMTEEVDDLIEDFFIVPTKISIAVSGTPLENISQQCYQVRNFYTKVNLIEHLLRDKAEYNKVLVFVTGKKSADRLFECLTETYGSDICIIHSNKTQNYRIRSIEEFDSGAKRILIATDVISRGLDLDRISHVVNFDVPLYPENYMHRIGRTGRADQLGKSLLFYTEKEEELKLKVENLMSFNIPVLEFPEEVEINPALTPEEQIRIVDKLSILQSKIKESGPSTHEKKEKNLKVNEGGSYRKKLAEKYKKPRTKGDKFTNNKKKK